MASPFMSLGIRPALTRLLEKTGIRFPTPVQEQAIPAAIDGQDVLVQAQTGTGKTLAFLLPILERLRTDQNEVQALILTPTRELAIQIAEEAKKLSDAVDVSTLAVYGGQDVIAQIYKLERAPDMIIATPGRLADHLRRGTIRLSRLSMLVLDEADQMLHMGFLPEVEEIIDQTPESRQTMLYSATFPDSVRSLARRYMRNPADIRVEGKRITLEGIRQYVAETTDRAKRDTLMYLIRQQRPFLAVLFCRTKIRAKKLAEFLKEQHLSVDELHGDLTQAKREDVMKRFRSAELQLLVATDVAARGLDVEGVTHVFNYDIPHDPESYIHRIGRTGRAGQSGIAITLAAPKDATHLRDIEAAIGSRLEKLNIPARTGGPSVEGKAHRAVEGGSVPNAHRRPAADSRAVGRTGRSAAHAGSHPAGQSRPGSKRRGEASAPMSSAADPSRRGVPAKKKDKAHDWRKGHGGRR